jgi:hypothetical protein
MLMLRGNVNPAAAIAPAAPGAFFEKIADRRSACASQCATAA